MIYQVVFEILCLNIHPSIKTTCPELTHHENIDQYSTTKKVEESICHYHRTFSEITGKQPIESSKAGLAGQRSTSYRGTFGEGCNSSVSWQGIVGDGLGWQRGGSQHVFFSFPLGIYCTYIELEYVNDILYFHWFNIDHIHILKRSECI